MAKSANPAKKMPAAMQKKLPPLMQKQAGPPDANASASAKKGAADPNASAKKGAPVPPVPGKKAAPPKGKKAKGGTY